ncbi:MAG: hypothetical protein WBP58_05165 [Chitinophagaceae bacterium]
MELKDYVGVAGLTAAVGVGIWVADIKSRLGATVPTNAIVAFDTACPKDGWEPYGRANGKFLLGADSSAGEPGGKPEITLSEENLPKFTLSGQTVSTEIILYTQAYQPGTPDTNQLNALTTQRKTHSAAGDLKSIETPIKIPGTAATINSTENMTAKPINIMPPHLPIVYCRKT